MWDKVPGPVARCCAALRDAGEEAYPVGGCVRDLLLGLTPGDWDLTTSARPEQVMALFEKTIPTGLKHGTVTVLLEGMALEVTTFRREMGYSDGRRPDGVDFTAGLADDLSRRDFTINAMALGSDGGVVDLFGGRADLARRVIRCVGEPDRRFQEDALRMLRAVRFSARLGFAMEGETMAAIRRNAALADCLSAERVRGEVERILCSDRPELAAIPVALGMLRRFGAAAAEHDLCALRAVPLTPAARWRALCAATGLDITHLPVERRLRRAVLHPEEAVLETLALTGGELHALGYRGGEIGALRRALAVHITAHPEDNEHGRLLAMCREMKKVPRP